MLKKIKKLLINKNENRLRGLWRISLQKIIKIVLLIIVFIFASEQVDNLLVGDNGSWTSIEGVIQNSFRLIITIMSVFLTVKFIDKRDISQLGISLDKNRIIDFSFAFIIQAVIIALFFWIELKTGFISIKEISFDGMKLFLGFWSCVCIGLREEILFRGYYLINFSESFNIKKHISSKMAIILACILTSILFGAGHLKGSSSAPKMLLFSHFISGILYGGIYILTEDLLLPISMHISHNFFTGVIFGHFGGGTLIDIKFNFASYMSVLVNIWYIIVTILSGGLVLLWLKIKYGRFKLCTNLSEYK
jgi:membrane protease YdiL (CAAX protease family)